MFNNTVNSKLVELLKDGATSGKWVFKRSFGNFSTDKAIASWLLVPFSFEARHLLLTPSYCIRSVIGKTINKARFALELMFITAHTHIPLNHIKIELLCVDGEVK